MWRERLQSCPPGPEGVERTLEELAETVTATLGRQPLAERWWRAAGIQIRERAMRARGRCDTSRVGAPVVLVRSADNRYAQGFTVAHEVAHLLVDQLPFERRSELGYEQVEKLCDGFARNVLVPPARLRAELGPRPEVPEPSEVLRLCGLFVANPSVVLRSLERELPFDGRTYLLARLRGHYRRPAAIAFRVDATAGTGKLFWPQDIRLAKLGLAVLAGEGERASHGEHFSGRDSEVVIPLARLDRTTDHNAMSGPVSWQAVRQGKGGAYLLALLDTHELRGVRVGGERRAIPRPKRQGVPEVIDAR